MKIHSCCRMILSVCLLVSVNGMGAQETPQKAPSKEYVRSEAMVPMRDGVKLHVVMLRPVGSESTGDPLPFLMERTPYGVDNNSSKTVNGSKPELAVPIKLAGRVLGVFHLESSRLAPSDNILVHEIAHLIARFLTSNGKHLVRKARESARAAVAENVTKPYRATSDKNPAETNLRRAAAGEASRA